MNQNISIAAGIGDARRSSATHRSLMTARVTMEVTLVLARASSRRDGYSRYYILASMSQNNET